MNKPKEKFEESKQFSKFWEHFTLTNEKERLCNCNLCGKEINSRQMKEHLSKLHQKEYNILYKSYFPSIINL